MDTTNPHIEKSHKLGACNFLVLNGSQAGAKFELLSGTKATVGSDIDNDIIVHNSTAEPWSVVLEHDGINVQLTTKLGELRINDETPSNEFPVIVTEHDVLCAGRVEFKILFEKNRAGESALKALADNQPLPNATSHFFNNNHTEYGEFSKSTGRSSRLIDCSGVSRSKFKGALIGFVFLSVALGAMTALYAVTGSNILEIPQPGENTSLVEDSVFKQSLKELNINSIISELSIDGEKYMITGIVDTRDQRNKLLEIARYTDAKVEVDVQVNDELVESVEDIYRVNGIKASASVLGRGQIQVHTATSDIEKLESVEESVKEDIPALSRITVINNPPETVLKPKGKYKENPDKRVTLIVAGVNAYVMTQDKSRYFVGALLPSGHVIESIEDGDVVVSRDGLREKLKY